MLGSPVGTYCQQGATLEALPLMTGYYRLDSTTVDVREVRAGLELATLDLGVR